MKAREGSWRFSDSKKRLAPGEVLRKMSWRRGVVCEKQAGADRSLGKNYLASKGLRNLTSFRVLTSTTFYFTVSLCLTNIYKSRTLSSNLHIRQHTTNVRQVRSHIHAILMNPFSNKSNKRNEVVWFRKCDQVSGHWESFLYAIIFLKKW